MQIERPRSLRLPDRRLGSVMKLLKNGSEQRKGTPIMKDSTKDKIEGTAHAVKGAVKQKLGSATNNPALESEGKGEKAAGKVQKKVGEIEKVAEK
jgi:uncharacterized protein YjbJ (UPF0337 family)